MPADKTTLDALKIERPPLPSRRSLAPFVVIVILILVVGLGLAWWRFRAGTVVVRTAMAEEVSSTGARTLLNASGYVTARRAATVSSKVTGRVVDVLIEEGAAVEAGQVLARIDASNAEAALRLAEAQLDSARRALGETQAALEQAERTKRRTEHLASSRVVSESDLDQAVADVAVLKARLQRQEADVRVAESQVAQYKLQFDDTVIRAPFAGVVTSKNAQPGEMISPMSAGGSFTRTGICTIVDMSSLEVEVDVNESYINRVSDGQPVVVTLDSYPDWRIPAHVIAIIPTADRQKATVRVRVAFNQLDPRMLPDMGLKVAFQSANDEGVPTRRLAVPASGVRRDGDRDIVWVLREGHLERRAVAVSERTGDRVLIASGLSRDERVVIEGPEILTDGEAAREDQP